MDFGEFLEGIEKLIVRILLWIVIVPKTLYQIFTEPDWVVGYIEKEMKEGETDRGVRFDDYISPILLFLICSLVLFIIMDSTNLSGNSNENLDNMLKTIQGVTGFLGGLAFLSLPLLFALAIETFRRRKIRRSALVRTLNIQCYYFSPLTLSIFSYLIITTLLPTEPMIGLFAGLIAFGTMIWFIIVEVKFIKDEIGGRLLKSVSILFGCAMFIIVMAILIVYTLDGSAAIDDDWEGGTETYQWNLEDDGQYTIEISGYEGARYGGYQLIVENAAPAAELRQLDPTGENSGLIPYDHSVSGQYSGSEGVEWEFMGQAGDFVDIVVIPDEFFDVTFQVIDEQGEPIRYVDASGDGAHEQVVALELPKTGYYSVWLDGYEGSTGSYDLQLVQNQLVEIADNSENGQVIGEIGYDQFVQSSFVNGDSVKWVFDGKANDLVTVSVVPDANFDAIFDVQNKNGRSILDSRPQFIPIGLGYIYVLLVGLALILGLRSIWQNRSGKKAEKEEQLVAE